MMDSNFIRVSASVFFCFQLILSAHLQFVLHVDGVCIILLNPKKSASKYLR